MRGAALKIIVFAISLGMTIVVVATLATHVASLVSESPESRIARLVANDTLPAVQPNGEQLTSGLPRPNRPIVPETIGAAAKMFPDGLTIDFGAVPHGVQLLHRFPITNNRATPIEIAYLQVGCSCTTSSAAKRILQPGESSTIDVGVDGSRFTGPVEETVRVKVVGPNFESTCKLILFADAKEGSASQPDTVSVRTAAR